MKTIAGIFILFLVLFSGVAECVCGQPGSEAFSLKKFTTDQGLVHDNVQYITQDSTGFIWIATWDGISRFDGNEFRNYYYQPGSDFTLPYHVTDKLLVDRLNNVWLVTWSRPLYRYNRAEDHFENVFFDGSGEKDITDIAVCSGHELWMVNRFAFYRFNFMTGKCIRYPIQHEKPLPLNKIGEFPRIVTDNTGVVWITDFTDNQKIIYETTWSADSVLLLHPWSSKHLNETAISQIRNENAFYEIYRSPSGEIWLFSLFGLFKTEKGKEDFIRYTGPVDPEEFKGRAYYRWVDDNNELYIINTSLKRLTSIRMPPGNYVTSVLMDRKNIIWNGEHSDINLNTGFNRYTPVPDHFRHYLTEKDQSGNDHLVFPVLKDKNGDIWVGTRHSDKIFRIGGNWEVTQKSFLTQVEGKNGIRIKSVVQDSSGIWMGCTENYLIRYDFNTKNFIPIRIEEKNSKGEPLVLGIHNLLYSGTDLLINGKEGIYLYSVSTGKTRQVYRYEFYDQVYSMVEDYQGGYWLGLNNNTLIHLDGQFIQTGRYKVGSGQENVEHICPGDSNDVWIALQGSGLGHLVPETGRSEVFTTHDGLSNNVTYSILKDSEGDLWISTNLGLSRFNLRTRKFSNYDESNGLLIKEFDSDSWFQAPDGEMFFGGVGGLVSFYPDSLKSESINPLPLLFTDFRVSGIPRYFEKPVYESDTLCLEKGDNNFQATFACLDFENPQKIRYRYRLEDVDDQWIETDYRNRTISYANLTHRDYRLELEATDGNGEWLNRKSLLISIPHRFTELLWVRIVAAVFVLSFFSFVALVYFRQKRLKVRQQRDELRLESLRGQMNPHFIFNSLNSINYFISGNDKISANRYIADFSRLIRSILDNMSEDYVSLEQEAESLSDYMRLEHLRFGNKFTYKIDDGNVADKEEVWVIPGLVQPFIENAIWHGIRNLQGRVGHISVSFGIPEKDVIRCTVEDDGVGRVLSEKYKSDLNRKKSKGIGIVLERLRLIRKIRNKPYEVIIEDLFPGRKETGTRVVIDIPLKV